MVKTIDLSADMGEGFGVYPAPMQVWRADFDRGGELAPSQIEIPSPRRIMQLVSSVSLACGFHAGDPLLIKRYVELAAETGCAVGAHPSLPDRPGFGNRYMELSCEELKAVLQYQIAALAGLLSLKKLRVSHVKTHGALYNRSMVDEALARTVVEAVAEYDEKMALYGLPDSALEEAARRAGLPFRREGFADRAYHANGKLVDRKRQDAMVLDPETVAGRVLRMARDGTVESVEGSSVRIDPETICFHPDTPGMMSMLEKSRQSLQRSEIKVGTR